MDKKDSALERAAYEQRIKELERLLEKKEVKIAF